MGPFDGLFVSCGSDNDIVRRSGVEAHCVATNERLPPGLASGVVYQLKDIVFSYRDCVALD